jgi:hypothetical protein
MAIRRTKTGIEKLYRKEKGNLECDVGCKPLFWAAIVAFAEFATKTPTKLNKIKSKGLEFGFITLSRPSEIFKTDTSTHDLQAEDMVFDIKSDDNETTKITSDEIDQFDWSLITGLNVSIGKHGTKNDQTGIASQYYYDIKTDGTYCFVKSMYEHACICKPNKGEAFFTCNTDNKKWRLTYAHYGQAVKAAATLAGITDTKGYTQKSTRVGAATTLAALNVPDYTIKDLGRWNSTAFMTYIRISLKQFSMAINILTDVNSFTLQDAQRCNPKLLSTA